MLTFRALYFLLFLFILVSCSKNNIENSVIKEKSLELQVLEAYDIGKDALESGDVLYAAKKFNEVETLFPQSDLAPRSALMAAYSYYIQDYYSDSIAELERFIKVYPYYKDISYAHYLIGICYFEQIVDEKKDLQSLINAKKNFDYVMKNYPNSEYALDASFKNAFSSIIDIVLKGTCTFSLLYGKKCINANLKGKISNQEIIEVAIARSRCCCTHARCPRSLVGHCHFTKKCAANCK